MPTLDYSRASSDPFTVEVNSLFNAIIDVAQDDAGSVDFTSKTVIMDIMEKQGKTPIVTLTSGTEITISTNRLTFSKIFSELSRKTYHYELYNDTDKVSIGKGRFVVI